MLKAFNDPLGLGLEGEYKRVANALSKRNASILAHGTTPVKKETYEEVSQVLEDFLVRGLALVGHPMDQDLQMPMSFSPILRSFSE